MITATTRDGKFTLAIGAAARVRRDSGIYKNEWLFILWGRHCSL